MRRKYTALTVLGVPAGFVTHNYKLLVREMCAEPCGRFCAFVLSKRRAQDEGKFF